MRRDHFITGLIALVMGVWGLLSLYDGVPFPLTGLVVGYLTGTGALALFLLLIIAGLFAILHNWPHYYWRRGRAVLAYSNLKMTVLRYLAIGKSADEIAHITGVAKTEVYRKVDELQAEGYVIDDNRLTEKGYDALHWDRRELGPPAPIA